MSSVRHESPAMDMQQFEAAFLEEAAEHLADLERLLVSIDLAAPEPDELDAIFRAAHSLKGGSGMFGFNDMTALTHNLETLLDKVRKRELPLRSAMVDLLLESSDLLHAQLAHYGGQAGSWQVPIEDICARIKVMAESPTAASATPAPAPQDSNASPAPLAAAAAAPAPAGTPAGPPPSATRTLVLAFPAGAEVEALLPDLFEQLGQMGTLRVVEPDAPAAVALADLTARGKPRKRARKPAATALRTLHLTTAAAEDVVLTLFDFVMDAALVSIATLPVAPELSAAASPAAAGYTGMPLRPAAAATTPATMDHTESALDAGYGFFHPSAVAANSDSTAEPPDPPPAAPALAANPGVTPAATVSARTPDRQSAGAETSIRVSVEKVDQLINQVGELVITQAMLAQSAAKLDPVLHEKLLAGMADLERNTREMQESVMSIRMLPIAFVFNRFPRLVRDLAAKLGKDVQLVTQGEGTELDKGLIERISDPLTHLVRNAIDHGIEMPAQRIAAGKVPHGTITLRAGHQGGNIVIHISDDGAGLDRARILAKARERGMAVSDTMADAEVWKLIFAAGFSTAQVVSDISGRGVGMDVVRRNIDALGGSVEIDSVPGTGMRITVRLPLTLAIMDGMTVAVDGEVYVLPLASIVESLHATADQVHTVAGGGLVVNVRGDYLPVLSLHQLLVDRGAVSAPAGGTMVIVEAEEGKTALRVDELLGQQQVVVKSLDANYRKVHGLSGATIMGDGRVALILDVSTLTRGRREAAGTLH